MDIDTIYQFFRTFWVVWLFLLFALIVVWVMWPRRKKEMEEHGRIPLKDDEGEN
jgi:cbb3-type cytochrome oxidase subunit 3